MIYLVVPVATVWAAVWWAQVCACATCPSVHALWAGVRDVALFGLNLAFFRFPRPGGLTQRTPSALVFQVRGG
jgi:hypothetical protein